MGVINNNQPGGTPGNIPGDDGSLIVVPAGTQESLKAVARSVQDLIEQDDSVIQPLLDSLANQPILDAPKSKEALQKFLSGLTQSAAPGAPAGPLFVTDAGGNEWLAPNVMATLAVIMGELGEIYGEIMRQSSQLQQGMMKMTVAMAMEVYNYAMQAGDAKVKQLELEVVQHVVSAVCAAVSIVATAGLLVGNKMELDGNKKKFDAQKEKVEDMELAITAKTKNTEFQKLGGEKRLKELEDKGLDSLNPTEQAEFRKLKENELLPQEKTALDKFKDNESVLTDDNLKTEKAKLTELKAERQSEDQKTSTKFQMLNPMVQQFSTMINSGAQALTTAMKIPAVLSQTQAEAMKEMLGQLMQLLQNTMSSAQHEGQAASDEWKKLNDIYTRFADTMTRVYG